MFNLHTKEIPSCRNLFPGLFLLSVLLLSGCGGGAGHNPGNNPGPVNPDPGQGQGINPATIDLATVDCKGQVVVRQPNGRTQGLPGVTMTSRWQGNIADSVITDQNGVYRLSLQRGQHNAVRASLAGYEFEPPVILINPTLPEVLPEVVGTRLAAGQAPAGAVGRISVRLTGDPATSPLGSGWVDTIDAVTRETLENRSLAGFDSYSMRYPVGTQIIITPRPNGNLKWIPSARMVRVTPNDQTLNFQWQMEQPQPQPRPVIRSPVAQATPRPLPSSSVRPILRPPAATPTPTPRFIRMPVSQP